MRLVKDYMKNDILRVIIFHILWKRMGKYYPMYL